jgi:hypothetical protein
MAKRKLTPEQIALRALIKAGAKKVDEEGKPMATEGHAGERCPKCGSPKREERWCMTGSPANPPHAVYTSLCILCDHTWHAATEPASQETAGHTPGPWAVTDIGIRDHGGYICFTKPPTHYQGQDQRYEKELAERNANKWLIASAPDLLAENTSLRDQLAAKTNELAICHEGHLQHGKDHLVLITSLRARVAELEEALGVLREKA